MKFFNEKIKLPSFTHTHSLLPTYKVIFSVPFPCCVLNVCHIYRFLFSNLFIILHRQKVYFYFISLCVRLHMYVYQMNSWCLWKAKEGIGFPGTEIRAVMWLLRTDEVSEMTANALKPMSSFFIYLFLRQNLIM